jgi:predicted lipoprotein with Yx(FWY)xxD motif
MRALLLPPIFTLVTACDPNAPPQQSTPTHSAIIDAPLPAAISLVQEANDYHFTDDDGGALYTFDRDSAGESACVGQCATRWLPVPASGDAHQVGDWAPIRRNDGSLQWAYKGKPVYTFTGDTNPGQHNGDGADDGAWHWLNP